MLYAAPPELKIIGLTYFIDMPFLRNLKTGVNRM